MPKLGTNAALERKPVEAINTTVTRPNKMANHPKIRRHQAAMPPRINHLHRLAIVIGHGDRARQSRLDSAETRLNAGKISRWLKLSRYIEAKRSQSVNAMWN